MEGKLSYFQNGVKSEMADFPRYFAAAMPSILFFTLWESGFSISIDIGRS